MTETVKTNLNFGISPYHQNLSKKISVKIKKTFYTINYSCGWKYAMLLFASRHSFAFLLFGPAFGCSAVAFQGTDTCVYTTRLEKCVLINAVPTGAVANDTNASTHFASRCACLLCRLEIDGITKSTRHVKKAKQSAKTLPVNRKPLLPFPIPDKHAYMISR